MGRLTGEDRPDGGQVDYSYDDNGNVTAILNPNTIEHGFSYTANDQRERGGPHWLDRLAVVLRWKDSLVIGVAGLR